MKKRLGNFLATDWMPDDKQHSFALGTFYVQLEWMTKIRKPLSVDLEHCKSLHDLVKSLQSDATGGSSLSSDISSLIITGKLPSHYEVMIYFKT